MPTTAKLPQLLPSEMGHSSTVLNAYQLALSRCRRVGFHANLVKAGEIRWAIVLYEVIGPSKQPPFPHSLDPVVGEEF